MTSSDSRWLTVRESAQMLDVGAARVRQLISAGELMAEPFGDRWRVDLGSVLRRQRDDPGDGRPLDATNCWLVIQSIEEPGAVAALPAWQARRVRRHRSDLLSAHRTAPLRRRARRSLGRVHPGLLPELESEAVIGGAAAQPPDTQDRLVEEQIMEIYVSAATWPTVAESVAFDVDGPPNVLAHIVEVDHWHHLEGRRSVPAVVAALDLADQGDPRAERAARAILLDLRNGLGDLGDSDEQR